MYSIGMFSKINRVTTKTLRHYDEIGLLKPCHTDSFTGYRYYDSAQLPRMHKICMLKQMGCTLTEIMSLLDEGSSTKTLAALLRLKKAELESSIDDERRRLLCIESFLCMLTQEKDWKGDFMGNYTATIREIPATPVAYVRKVIGSYDDLYALCEGLARDIDTLGCKRADPPYSLNIDHNGEYRERDIDIECCEAVTETRPDTDALKFKVLPAITAACVLHKGPYDGLGQAYAFITKWAEQGGYRICGAPRESHIDGVWNKPDPRDYLTEIQFPVEKA